MLAALGLACLTRDPADLPLTPAPTLAIGRTAPSAGLGLVIGRIEVVKSDGGPADGGERATFSLFHVQGRKPYALELVDAAFVVAAGAATYVGTLRERVRDLMSCPGFAIEDEQMQALQRFRACYAGFSAEVRSGVLRERPLARSS